MDKKEKHVIIGVVGVLLIALISQNLELSGNVSRSFELTRELGLDEYRFNLGDVIFIGGKRVTLVGMGDSEEVIVDVSGVQKSVNLAGARNINNLQVENHAVGLDNAILKVIPLIDENEFCNDSDEGDIYAKGTCFDRFYTEKGVGDFCDFRYLKEYTCGYDSYVGEIHCLKHIVECADGCKNGACVVR
tara:strand:- start:675 stop:1241 length:567 start_codon:yes stop_codon:yes gene_type:complete